MATVTAVARGTATITVTAADPAGLEASLDFQVTVPDTVTVANRRPVVAAELPDLELETGVKARVNISSGFTDPDGDALTFRAASSDPAVASASVAGGVATVTAIARGTATITVTAADPAGLEASLDFEVTVPNRRPVGTGSMPNIELRDRAATVTASAYFNDPDGDELTYGATSSDPDVVGVETAADRVTVSPLPRRWGTETVTVTATDPGGLSASLSFDVTVPNRGPVLLDTPPDLDLTVGEEHVLVLSRFFFDLEGDSMTFSASSSDETRASVTTSEDTVRITARTSGSARVTVQATDAPGTSTEASFGVTISPVAPPPARFDIDIAWHSSMPSSARQAIRQAVGAWEGILVDTELSNISVNDKVTCGGYTTADSIEVIDDLLILFVADSIDGSGGVLGRAGPCSVRTGSDGLPAVGVVIFDSNDVGSLLAAGLWNLAMHEIAHALGFGSLWDLTNPSAGSSGSVDTHFPGAKAVAAFNAAGGRSYTGGKVPVANVNPGRDAHWRGSMFSGELMAPTISTLTTAALSAISIQALADLGYTVKTSSADPFSVTWSDRAPDRLPAAEAGRMLPLEDDILRTEIRVIDEDGRVVRVIPPR